MKEYEEKKVKKLIERLKYIHLRSIYILINTPILKSIIIYRNRKLINTYKSYVFKGLLLS